jgi:type II secretory pathway pseudopilin PulG
MSTDFIPFVSYLLAALAVAGVLVVGILATLVGESLVVARRQVTQRDEARASLAAAFGRVSHQS